MKSIKKILIIFIYAIVVTALTACNTNENDNESNSDYIVVSKIQKTATNKTYLEVDGDPFIPTGIQIRTDLLLYKENKSIEEIKDYFELAASLGVSMIQIPLPWFSFETDKDVYTFRDVGKMMEYAQEFGLKMEILLFTVNVTGWSNEVPDYIANAPDIYPRYPSLSGNGIFLVQNNMNLLKREAKAVNALMDAIYNWSKSNNDEHVVIGVQIHNESDVFPRFVLSQQKIMTLDNSRRLTDIEAWEETLEAYDYIGKVIKNSKYRVVTRANVALAWKDSWDSFVPPIFQLEGIDIVGDDTYDSTISVNKTVIENLNSNTYFSGNNFPHISENDGSFISTPSLILAATALGGGYYIYDLATPIIALDEYGWDDWSIYNPRTLDDKSHTQLTRSVLNGIALAGKKYILADIGNIAVFNVEDDIPQLNITQNIQTKYAKFTFETETGALAYAITYNDVIYIYSTSAANISVSNVILASQAQVGSINKIGDFIEGEDRVSITDNKLIVEGGYLYKIDILTINKELESNVIDNIG